MNISVYLPFVLFISFTKGLIFKNKILLCKECVHFLPYPMLDIDIMDEYKYALGKCKLFKLQNNVSDTAHAFLCRNNNQKCGKEGHLFEQKQ